jgi:Uma2 family endonuclease
VNLSARPKVRINVDQFLASSQRQPHDRYQPVDGETVAMPWDTIRYNRAKMDAVRAAALTCRVFIDGVGVKISDATLPIPDVAAHCQAVDRQAMIVESPLIATEVESWSSDVDTKFVDEFTVAGICHYLFQRERNATGRIESRIVQDGETALDPPGISSSVAALLGS